MGFLPNNGNCNVPCRKNYCLTSFLTPHLDYKNHSVLRESKPYTSTNKQSKTWWLLLIYTYLVHPLSSLLSSKLSKNPKIFLLLVMLVLAGPTDSTRSYSKWINWLYVVNMEISMNNIKYGLYGNFILEFYTIHE